MKETQENDETLETFKTSVETDKPKLEIEEEEKRAGWLQG